MKIGSCVRRKEALRRKLSLFTFLEMSTQEWDATFYSDGRVHGYIGDTEFAFDPDVDDPENFVSEIFDIVMAEKDETEAPSE